MRIRVHLPDAVKGWRLACLCTAFISGGLGLHLLTVAVRWAELGGGGFASYAAIGPAALGIACFVVAAMLSMPSMAGAITSPVGRLFEQIFYPSERIREPPKDLLFALRMRLRDRYWDSVDQQTRALIEAYGHSPELHHLRAHLEGGRSGSYSTVTLEASVRLSARGFDRYTELLRRDPPPREIQTGIEA
jgi:hypothetical protein